MKIKKNSKGLDINLWKIRRGIAIDIERHNPIPKFKLSKHLKHCKCIHSLSKSIAYSLSKKEDRDTEEWLIYKTVYKTQSEFDMRNIAIYSEYNYINRLSDIKAVDFSEIKILSESNILEKYPYLKQSILLELRLIYQG